MSWDGKATNKDKLFTIIFKSKVEGSLSKYIHLSSAVTPALAIAKGEKLEDEIELIATNKSNEQIEFAVMQNEPNPWSKETHIGMFLPTSGEVQMTIYDAAGKVFLQEEKLLKGGYNEWNVDDNILPQSGVYYYQVDFAGQTITKKMVL
ncbi:MAG: T9SS type A sorting domain-containing protein [Saprospiraceae bacterium]|nr:T9SS type A sorting domain-containing protein [Saprospiraceae bacterium]